MEFEKPNISEFYSNMLLDKMNFLAHEGTKRHSGRFPYGSGENPYQHEPWYNDSKWFYSRVQQLKSEGKKMNAETIEKEFGMTTTQFQNEMRLASYIDRLDKIDTVHRLMTKGTAQNGWKPITNRAEISRITGIPEGTIKSLLDPDKESRMYEAQNTADDIKKIIDNKKMVDVGGGVAESLGIPQSRLDAALFLLEKQGYKVYSGRINQTGSNKTTQKVLCVPGTDYKDIYNYENVKTLLDYKSDEDGNITQKKKINPPVSFDQNRVGIVYREDGGSDMDGTILIRKGVPELDLEGNTYAQVRILVGEDKYLKGMAIPSNDLPKGKDIMFYTNKSKDVPFNEVLKTISDDPDNPFKSAIKGQNYYKGKDGKEHQGVINYRAIEGDWDDWSNATPSQFLAKQPKELAKQQLDIAKDGKKIEFEEIQKISNPVVKKYYLKQFADNCDKAAETLKAAPFPNQRYQVLLASPSLSDKEVYAPNYENGTKLALVRYPHGGRFEIPILTVNNNNKYGKKTIGGSTDAVMVNPVNANRLSGADYDGDTVMCIPVTAKSNIQNAPELKELKGFDPSISYGASKKVTDKDGKTHYYDETGAEYPIMSEKYKQKMMGVASNLITDMTVKGADEKELGRATAYSMVVIDAVKHKLNWKKAAHDYNISDLQRRYQNGGGVSTIISRAKSPTHPVKSQGEYKINIKGTDWYDPTRPEGAKIFKVAEDRYRPAGKKYDKKTGIMKLKTADGKWIEYDTHDEGQVKKYAPARTDTTKSGKPIYSSDITNADGTIHYKTEEITRDSTRMADTDDARTLMSSTTHPEPIEVIYADYANSMKDMANKARVEYYYTKSTGKDKEAAKTYAAEVASVTAKLNNAMKNRPMEREAQRRTVVARDKKIKEAEAKGQKLDKEDIRKINQKTLTNSRAELGTKTRKERNIVLTPKEYEAINAGAFSDATLNKILSNSDPDTLRDMVTPHDKRTIPTSVKNRINAMSNMNYTNNEIAKLLGVSVSTVIRVTKGDN